jgi:hypothetical protein
LEIGDSHLFFGEGETTTRAEEEHDMLSGKIDLYKQHKDEYVTPRKPVLVKTGPTQYLAINGRGAPGCERFCACIGALYAVAFTIKMARKFAGERDYAVC